MSQGQSPVASTVLLLEADPFLRRLITLGLQHRGLQIVEADSLSSLEQETLSSIDLLVLDVDSDLTSDWSILVTAQSHYVLSTLPTIVLSWDPSIINTDSEAHSVSTSELVTYQTKPFDARALHSTIDQYLLMRERKKEQALAQAEAVLLASYSSQSSPSIWPVVTAAGLLLMVIGLLFQIAIAVIGGLVVLIGLLLWTLGGRSESSDVALAVRGGHV